MNAPQTIVFGRWLTLVLALIPAFAAAAQLQGIHVSGQGSVEVEPDMGDVRLHVRREGRNAVDLGKESRCGQPIIRWVSLHLPQMRNLSLEVSNSFQSCIKFLIVFNHLSPRQSR